MLNKKIKKEVEKYFIIPTSFFIIYLLIESIMLMIIFHRCL